MKHVYFLILFILISIACQKEKKSGSNLLMISPAKNEICAVGSEPSDNLASISFTWKPFKNETAYRLYIKNVITSEETKYVVNDTNYKLFLNKNTTYSWYVVGVNSEDESKEYWKFHIGNPSITNVPQPATTNYPLQGGVAYYYASGIELNWLSFGDGINTIKCDIYFGNNTNPPLIGENLIGNSDRFTKSVKVEIGKTYYWKVVSKNTFGNQATSPLFQFNVISLP